jgi:hypothetical protein
MPYDNGVYDNQVSYNHEGDENEDELYDSDDESSNDSEGTLGLSQFKMFILADL